MNHTDPVTIAPACAHRAAPMRTPATLLLALCLSLGLTAQLAAQTIPTISSASFIINGGPSSVYAKAGAFLVLTFVVLEANDSSPDPSAMIAGQDANVSISNEYFGQGFQYIASYQVQATGIGMQPEGPVTYDIGTVTSSDGGTLDPSPVISSIIIDTVAPSFVFASASITGILIVPDDPNLLESEVIEVTDVSYQAGGVGRFMALPTYTSIAVSDLLEGAVLFCAFGPDANVCVATDPDTTDDYEGIGFNDVYKIQAAAITDAAGNPNAEFDFTPRLPQGPEAPGNLQAVPGDMQVTLTWEVPAHSDLPIIRYEYRVAVDQAWEPVNPPTALTQIATGLTNDERYRFQVRAVSMAGNGVPSGSAFATPVSSPSLLARDIISLTATERRRTVILDVTWQQGPATGRAETTGFDVQYRDVLDPDLDGHYSPANVTITTVLAVEMQTAVITNLTLNTGYIVRVRTRAGIQLGEWAHAPQVDTDIRLNRAPIVTILESHLVHPAPLVTSPVTSGARVILSGRAVDLDIEGFGTEEDFVWMKISGTGGTLGESTSAETTPSDLVIVATFTAPIVATATDFIFTLTVTDNFDASTTGTVTVTVEPDTIDPTVQTWRATLRPSIVGQASTTTITFSEPVALETTDFTDINAPVDSVVAKAANDGITTPHSVEWTISYTPAAAGAVSLTLDADSVTDRAGRTAPATAATRTGTAFLDTTPPTVLTWEDPLQPSTVDQASTTTITFSEPVTQLEIADFTVINAPVDSVASSDGSTPNAIWEVTYTPTAVGAVSLTLNADSVTDRFGNTGPATAELRTGTADSPDTTAPTVLTWDALGTSTVGQASTTTITFSEPVALETTDFTVINADVDSVASSDGSTPNAIWEVTYTPIAAAEVSLTLNADSVTDRASNAGPATAELRTGTATVLLPTTLSGLDGVAGVDFADAKILYYAHAEAFSSVLSDDTDREAVLGNLTTRDTAEVLVDARALELDLNTDGDTDSADAAVFYYSFALEGSLGDGTANSGIPAIRNAILTPLLEGGSRTVDEMLQAAHALR